MGVMPQALPDSVRCAHRDDAPVIGRLLHEFNVEFDEPSPGAEFLSARIGGLLAGRETKVLLAGDPPVGLAVLRFRPALWTPALECYLAELYVAPAERGKGLGRALMEGAMQVARWEGANYMDLGTAEDDTAARALYESLGFNNRGGRPDGAVNYFYEREL
jgi:ribosomal protein S18 acetylase RimI-like enzyme